MSITKTAVVCALVVVTASAEATGPNEARDVTTLAFGKGTKQSTTKASIRPELLGQVPPMPGLSFFTACRAAVRKCLVVAPRSVLACVFSMPPSDGAMTRRCMLWIRRRDRAIALLMGRRGTKDDGEDEDDEKEKKEKKEKNEKKEEKEKKKKDGVQKAL